MRCMNRYHLTCRLLFTLFCVTILASCASTEEKWGLKESPIRYSDQLAMRAKPTSMNELENECRCMKDEINQVNAFSDKMRKSKFAFYYQSLGREKLSAIAYRTASLNCQQFQ